jgi:hypothetical protein
MRIKKGVVFPLRPLIVGKILSRLVLALFGPDAPDRRCPLIGEERKFAARSQSDAIDPSRTFGAAINGAEENEYPPQISPLRLTPRHIGRIALGSNRLGCAKRT